MPLPFRRIWLPDCVPALYLAYNITINRGNLDFAAKHCCCKRNCNGCINILAVSAESRFVMNCYVQEQVSRLPAIGSRPSFLFFKRITLPSAMPAGIVTSIDCTCPFSSTRRIIFAAKGRFIETDFYASLDVCPFSGNPCLE